MDQKLLSELLANANKIATEAGKAIMAVAREALDIQAKEDGSPLTRADIASHKVIVAGLAKVEPQFEILSEEGDLNVASKDWRCYWCVDPLDGTKEFVKGLEEYTVNIALVENGRPILGVIYVPAIDVLYYGGDAFGAWKIDSGGKARRISARQCKRAETAIVSRSHLAKETEIYLEQLGITNVIQCGSSVKGCMIAEGVADIHLRHGPTCLWDTAAGYAIVVEANCCMVDLSGKPLRYDPLSGLKHNGVAIYPKSLEAIVGPGRNTAESSESIESIESVELAEWAKKGVLRRMRVRLSAGGRIVEINGFEKIDFSSNNYLALANHKDIITSVKDGVDKWGFGAGASRLISGNTAAHVAIEKRLAKLLGKDAALTFTSGYATNTAILNTLAKRGDMIAIDKLVHASIIDGAVSSGAKVRIFGHGRMDKLERLLKNGDYGRVFIVTDSIFSMDGNIAPLSELVALKHRYGAILMVDEAHAFGCIGPTGMGCIAEAGLADDVDIIVVTFSKALGGTGGAVVSSDTIVDYLVNRSRGFIFTTATPAVSCIAAMQALDIVEQEPQRRGRLLNNAEYLRNKLREAGLNIGSTQSYIIPVIIGSANETLRVAGELFDRGFLTPAVRPPTVAPNTSRLRISVTAEHSHDDLDRLAETLELLVDNTAR